MQKCQKEVFFSLFLYIISLQPTETALYTSFLTVLVMFLVYVTRNPKLSTHRSRLSMSHKIQREMFDVELIQEDLF